MQSDGALPQPSLDGSIERFQVQVGHKDGVAAVWLRVMPDRIQTWKVEVDGDGPPICIGYVRMIDANDWVGRTCGTGRRSTEDDAAQLQFFNTRMEALRWLRTLEVERSSNRRRIAGQKARKRAQRRISA